jgi:hypothetical protein
MAVHILLHEGMRITLQFNQKPKRREREREREHHTHFSSSFQSQDANFRIKKSILGLEVQQGHQLPYHDFQPFHHLGDPHSGLKEAALIQNKKKSP